MNITMLGTGNALVTECYNTCFILSENKNNFLVDTGGGNNVIHQIKHAGFALDDIHDIFITHSHIDHLLGLIWIIRISAQQMNKNIFSGDINIYSHDEVINLLYELVNKLLLPYQAAFVGKRIHLITIHDGENKNITGKNFTFFNINSERTKQFGFKMIYGQDKSLTCCGDEPCHESGEHYVQNSTWLLHEAFCLYSQCEKFRPYEKYHSTVKDAAQLAQRLGVKNLLLYHTEDENLINRKFLYTSEAQKCFNGNIYVPDDLETLTLL